MSEFKLRIVCPEGEYFSGQAEILNVVTSAGQMGILPHMLPFAAVVEISEMNFVQNGTRRFFFVSGGFIYVTKEEVTLITDAIEDQDNIDLERAQRAKARAEKRLAQRDEKIDVMRAELALKRALTRIKVKSH